MQIRKLLTPHEIIKGKEFPINSIVLYLEDGMIFVCSNFRCPRSEKLKLFIWLPDQNVWVYAYANNGYTEIMWKFYRKHQEKRKNKHVNYEKIMEHDRKHKSGGGGSRIYNGSITDYECTKNPLHDFRRSYN